VTGCQGAGEAEGGTVLREQRRDDRTDRQRQVTALAILI
jgi:hypothetical protein